MVTREIPDDIGLQLPAIDLWQSGEKPNEFTISLPERFDSTSVQISQT